MAFIGSYLALFLLVELFLVTNTGKSRFRYAVKIPCTRLRSPYFKSYWLNFLSFPFSDSIERTSFLFSSQTQLTFVDLVGVKLIELMFTTSSQLFEYFSRLFTPEVQYLCKNVLILFHDFYRKINSLPLKYSFV